MRLQQLYLATGSNQGNSFDLLNQCNFLLHSRVGYIKKLSPVYKTQAWGKTDQPDFLNQVLLLETYFTPLWVFREIQAIEKQLGRKRYEKWGPRTIDIDILFYNTRIIENTSINIPHPEIPNRNFVLKPLLDIAPKFKHPELHKTIEQLWLNRTDKLEVTPYG